MILRISQFFAALTAGAFALATPVFAADAAKGGPNAAQQKVIFQVSDADPKKWNLTLNNASNVQEDLGKGNAEIEIVAYGPGIGMLKFDSEVSGRIAEALKSGVKVVACENTMRNAKISRADMMNGIDYVGAGVVELMNKQREGYAYIRP